MQLREAIEEFIEDLRLLGRADWTLKKHDQQLVRLASWTEDEGLDWREIDRRQLQQFARRRAHLGHSSRSNMLCSLRTFYGWSVEMGYVALSPAAGFKTPSRPKPLPRALSLEQVRRLISYLRGRAGRRARRDEALLVTALYTGMRASELAALRWPSVDLTGAVINVWIAKMNKGRAIPIHPALPDMLERWRHLQGLDRNAPVFSLSGKLVVPDRVGKIAREAAHELHIPLTAHVLRHTYATWALRRSHDLYGVSKSLGHADIRQTQVYVSADIEDLRPAVEALPPLDSW